MGWDDTEVKDEWLPVPFHSTQNVNENINAVGILQSHPIKQDCGFLSIFTAFISAKF